MHSRRANDNRNRRITDHDLPRPIMEIVEFLSAVGVVILTWTVVLWLIHKAMS